MEGVCSFGMNKLSWAVRIYVVRSYAYMPRMVIRGRAKNPRVMFCPVRIYSMVLFDRDKKKEYKTYKGLHEPSATSRN